VAEGSGAAKRFDLTVAERGVFGLKLEGDTLRYSPAGGAILATSLGVVVTGFLMAGSILIRKPATLLGTSLPRWLSVLVASMLFTVALARLIDQCRSGVVASPLAIEIRRRFGRASYSWAAIHDVEVIETVAPKVMHQRVTVGAAGGAISLHTSSSRAVLVLTDGQRVELRGFNAMAKASGMSVGMTTTSEIKVGALRRYRETFAGPWPSAHPGPE
jgi:hypothetical protein